MATFTVTTTADIVDPGDGELSLREAVRVANEATSEDSIDFAAGVGGERLVLSGGQITIRDDLVLDGDPLDSGTTTIDGDGAGRIFRVDGLATSVRLEDLTITGGFGGVREGDGGIRDGGAIYLSSGNALDVVRSNVVGNGTYTFDTTTGKGGAIFAARFSSLTIADSTLAENEGAFGGAVYAGTGSRLQINDSVLEDNIATGFTVGSGGAIYLSGASASISDSTITGNGATLGGGIFANASELQLTNSTVVGNRNLDSFGYGRGGGILANEGSAVVVAGSTVTGNEAGPTEFGGGGGIAVLDSTSLMVENSIVAGNYAGSFEDGEGRADDIRGGLTLSNGHNVFGSDVDGAVAAGDVENAPAERIFRAVDPETGGGRLTSNGGPTPTVALADSLTNPALSGADPFTIGDTDQRGVARPRPDDSAPDVGAFELDQDAVSTSSRGFNDAIVGTGEDDFFFALPGNDLVRGRGGDDGIFGDDGSDTLFGNWGDDRLSGGLGVNRLAGGPGNDEFEFQGVDTGNRDTITDFGRGNDVIDLQFVDSNTSEIDDQPFTFLGQTAFSGAPGELRYELTGEDTLVQGDVDGDAVADLAMRLNGLQTLNETDFVL